MDGFGVWHSLGGGVRNTLRFCRQNQERWGIYLVNQWLAREAEDAAKYGEFFIVCIVYRLYSELLNQRTAEN